MVRVSEIEDQSLLEDGKYTFKIKKCEKKSGKVSKYMNLELVVTKGPASGRCFFDMLMLGSNSLFRVKHFLMAFGYEDYDVLAISKDPLTKITVVDEEALYNEILMLVTGREAVADIITETGRINKDTGEKYPPRNRVRAYLPTSEAAGESVAWPE